MSFKKVEKVIFKTSASGEYRDVISGLNNKMALKFSPLGVEKNYLIVC
jgi:hypothetical protein